MKTRLPAVVIAPPRLGVPVLIPLASSSGKTPRGTRHAISPVFVLTGMAALLGVISVAETVHSWRRFERERRGGGEYDEIEGEGE